MNATKTKHTWAPFLKFFSEQNNGRKTRLGVFENGGDIVNDYWIEDGLPFSGIDIDESSARPTIEVMLESYTHPVIAASCLKAYHSLDGSEDGLDIIGDDGKILVLRFENK